MDEISKKREALMSAYSGPRWANRVKAMSEGQVVAVYLQLKSNNKL